MTRNEHRRIRDLQGAAKRAEAHEETGMSGMVDVRSRITWQRSGHCFSRDAATKFQACNAPVTLIVASLLLSGRGYRFPEHRRQMIALVRDLRLNAEKYA